MHNNQWEELIPFYVAQTLSRRESAAFEQHLASCDICQKSLTEWGAIASAVRAESAAHLRDLPPLSPALMAQMRGDYAPLPRSAQAWRSDSELSPDVPPPHIAAQQSPYFRKRAVVRPLPSFALAAAVMLVVVGTIVALMTLRNRMLVDRFAAGDETETPIASPSPEYTPTIFPTVGGVVTDDPIPMETTITPLIIFATSTPRPIQTVNADDPTEMINTPQATPTAPIEPVITMPQAVVRSETVNLRSGPGTAYDIVGTASPGTRLTIMARTGSGATLWYVVQHPQGGTAWVYGSVVVVEPPNVDIPTASTIPPPPTAAPTATPTITPTAQVTAAATGVPIHSGNWMHLATIVEDTCTSPATPPASYTEAVIIVPAPDGSYVAMTYAANGFSVTLYRTTVSSYAGTYTRTEPSGTSVSVTVTITFSTPTIYNGDQIARYANGCYVRTTWYGSAT